MGMEVIDSYGTKFDKTKHGSLFLSKVGIVFHKCDLNIEWK